MACLLGVERDGLTVWFAATFALSAKFVLRSYVLRRIFLIHIDSLVCVRTCVSSVDELAFA